MRALTRLHEAVVKRDADAVIACLRAPQLQLRELNDGASTFYQQRLVDALDTKKVHVTMSRFYESAQQR